MPTYQYRCTECGRDLEVVQKFTDPTLTSCPTCQGALRKVFNAVGVVFKGSGFYRTDSRTGKDGDSGSRSSKSSGSTEKTSGGNSSSGADTSGSASSSTGTSSSGSTGSSSSGSSGSGSSASTASSTAS